MMLRFLGLGGGEGNQKNNLRTGRGKERWRVPRSLLAARPWIPRRRTTWNSGAQVVVRGGGRKWVKVDIAER